MVRVISAAAGLLLVGLGLVSGPSASAIDACDVQIVDDTTDRVLGDQAVLRSAADDLISVGADVRIRAFDAVPGGTFDAYLREQIASCASWSTVDGADLKSNLIVFGVSLDEQSAIYAGSTWADSLTDPTVNRIRTEVMDVRFWDGDFAGGIADAQAEAYRVLTGVVSPVEPAPVSGASISSGSSDAFLTFVLWGVGAFVAIWILRWPVTLLIETINARRQRARQRREALARATQAQTDATAAIARLLKLDGAEVYASIQLVALQLDPQTEQALNKEVTAVRQRVAAAFVANAQFVDNPTRSVINPAADTDELRRVADEYEQIVAAATAAYGDYEQLAARAQQFDAAIAQAPQSLRETADRLTGTQQLLHDLEVQGFRIDGRRELEQAVAVLATARQSIEAGQPGHAIGALETVEAARREIHDRLDGLRVRQSELNGRLLALDSDLTVAEGTVSQAHDQLAALQDTYHPACSDDLASGLAAATQSIRAARHDLASARDHLSMQSQRWDEGAAALDRAAVQLREYSAPCQSVAARVEQLARLAASASGSVNRLEATIASAVTSVRAMRGDQDEHLSSLATLRRETEKLQVRVNQPKPDYLAIQRELEGLGSRRRQILDAAQEIVDRLVAKEREAAERERQRQAALQPSYPTAGYGGTTTRRSGYGGGNTSSPPRSTGSSGSWGGGGRSTGSSGGWGGKRR